MRTKAGRFHGGKQPCVFLWFLRLLLCFLLVGCRADGVLPEPAWASDEVPIHVASHGWHTGIIVEKQAVLTAIPGLAQFFDNARYLEFGWGDHDFYRASDISYALALKALLYPTDAVLHVVGVPRHPEDYFISSEIVGINISKAGFDKMLAFFQHTFKRDSHGSLILLGRGLYPDSLFFDAHGTYHAFYTCNSWIMDALRAGGLPDPVLPTLTAGGVMDQVDSYRTARR